MRTGGGGGTGVLQKGCFENKQKERSWGHRVTPTLTGRKREGEGKTNSLFPRTSLALRSGNRGSRLTD